MEIFRQNSCRTCTKFSTGFCCLLKRVGPLSKNKNTMKVVLLRWGKVRWFYWDDVSMFVLRTHCPVPTTLSFWSRPYSLILILVISWLIIFSLWLSPNLSLDTWETFMYIFQPWQTWKYLSIYIPWQHESVSHPPELAQSHIFPILFYLGERRAEEVINWV